MKLITKEYRKSDGFIYVFRPKEWFSCLRDMLVPVIPAFFVGILISVAIILCTWMFMDAISTIMGGL